MSPVMPCAVPADQSWGVGLTWESHERLWGAEKMLPFHKSIGRDRGAPFGEAVVLNLLIKCAQLGSPSWESLSSKDGFQL